MFYSLHRFATDWTLMRSDGHLEPLEVSSDEERAHVRRQARNRVIIQVIATLLMLGLSTVIVSSGSVDEAVSRLAFIGFGLVFGYWLR